MERAPRQTWLGRSTSRDNFVEITFPVEQDRNDKSVLGVVRKNGRIISTNMDYSIRIPATDERVAILEGIAEPNRKTRELAKMLPYFWRRNWD